jgi:hypothetical protein
MRFAMKRKLMSMVFVLLFLASIAAAAYLIFKP